MGNGCFPAAHVTIDELWLSYMAVGEHVAIKSRKSMLPTSVLGLKELTYYHQW